MTTLTKPRTFKISFAMAGSLRHELIVQLDPAGLIRFRQPRKRHWLDYPLARVYHLAAQAAADEIILRRQRRHND